VANLVGMPRKFHSDNRIALVVKRVKMIKEIKSINKIKVFLISFVLFLLLFVILDFAVLMLSRMHDGAIGVTLLSKYGLLQKSIAETGKLVPKEFSPVRISQGEYYLTTEYTYYYPDAWDKPGRILLKQKRDNFYYLIFGDKTMATVTYWSYKGDDPNVKPDYLQPTKASKYMFGNFWVIPLGAIIIAVTLFFVKKETK